ncbi:unnamed protein product [Pieris macdunnoughi]|uniref:G-protein coupled receptors family 2 profile 2 domain-containing protein n=1 Tax=Pieris macdunnoughi TaxID=345717 RepID=A0A821X0V6_9NEOP|nr:unnamed protein product [Pieris macdunnoughi]
MRCFLIVFFVYTVSCELCSRDERLNITEGVKFENESILFEDVEYVKGNWFELEDGTFGCPCIGRTCLWKCCGAGQAYVNRSCTDVDMTEVNPFNPPVYKGAEATSINASAQFFYKYTLSCPKYLVGARNNEFTYIQKNGTLYEIADGLPQWHPPARYCVEMWQDATHIEPILVAGVCYPDDGQQDVDSPALFIAYSIGLMISIPFLLATFLVYAFIPELRNLHGLCLMAYCGGLIIAYSFLSYLKLHFGKIGVDMTGCYIIAFIVYYTFQTSFFWLNIMCIDIWRTFSHGYRGTSNKRREKKRFALYGLYAWGVPAILTAVTIAMQYSENLPAGVVTPGFGTQRCWFADWMSELVYFFIPVFLLVICNAVLFTITAYRIRAIRQETAILKGAESSRSDKLKKDKQRYGLYLKLFVVMGVNWSVEVISFAVGGSNWYWVLIDLSNIALGIYIFFIFVWKNKVRNLITKKWQRLRGVRMPETSTGRWMSSSAQTEDTRISHDETGIRLKELR